MLSKEPSDPTKRGRSSRSGGDGQESLRITLPCSDVVEVPAGRAAEREPGQTTFSAIGDVGVAADDLAKRLGGPPKRFHIASILGFFLLLYILSAGVGLYALKSPPWVRVFVAPLWTVLIATLAYAGWQRWKTRALDLRFKLKIWQEALGSVGHQAANSVNAIRANLMAFRQTHSEHGSDEHLTEVEAAVQRIDEVIQRSADPLAWKGSSPQPPSCA